MFEVVSLQKHTECAAGPRGRLQSPTEEEEPEEGTQPSGLLKCCGWSSPEIMLTVLFPTEL